MHYCQFVEDEHDPRIKRCTRRGCGRELITPDPPDKCLAPCRSQMPQGIGPGTWLTRGLARWHLRHCEACDCQSKAALMDRLGWRWCERRVDTIVGWLRDNAAKCGYCDLYTDFAARWVVRRAIRKARTSELQARAKSRSSASGPSLRNT